MNNGFQEAIQHLINAQAQLTAAQATLTSTQTIFLERMAKSDERFARIEADLDGIKAILIRHEQILENLPDQVKAKIGFQGKDR